MALTPSVFDRVLARFAISHDEEEEMRFLNGTEPLGLPKGSVRAILTLAIVGVTLAQFIRGETVPELLAGAFLAILAFYGLTRATANNGGK